MQIDKQTTTTSDDSNDDETDDEDTTKRRLKISATKQVAQNTTTLSAASLKQNRTFRCKKSQLVRLRKTCKLIVPKKHLCACRRSSSASLLLARRRRESCVASRLRRCEKRRQKKVCLIETSSRELRCETPLSSSSSSSSSSCANSELICSTRNSNVDEKQAMLPCKAAISSSSSKHSSESTLFTRKRNDQTSLQQQRINKTDQRNNCSGDTQIDQRVTKTDCFSPFVNEPSPSCSHHCSESEEQQRTTNSNKTTTTAYAAAAAARNSNNLQQSQKHCFFPNPATRDDDVRSTQLPPQQQLTHSARNHSLALLTTNTTNSNSATSSLASQQKRSISGGRKTITLERDKQWAESSISRSQLLSASTAAVANQPLQVGHRLLPSQVSSNEQAAKILLGFKQQQQFAFQTSSPFCCSGNSGCGVCGNAQTSSSSSSSSRRQSRRRRRRCSLSYNCCANHHSASCQFNKQHTSHRRQNAEYIGSVCCQTKCNCSSKECNNDTNNNDDNTTYSTAKTNATTQQRDDVNAVVATKRSFDNLTPVSSNLQLGQNRSTQQRQHCKSQQKQQRQQQHSLAVRDTLTVVENSKLTLNGGSRSSVDLTSALNQTCNKQQISNSSPHNNNSEQANFDLETRAFRDSIKDSVALVAATKYSAFSSSNLSQKSSLLNNNTASNQTTTNNYSTQLQYKQTESIRNHSFAAASDNYNLLKQEQQQHLQQPNNIKPHYSNTCFNQRLQHNKQAFFQTPYLTTDNCGTERQQQVYSCCDSSNCDGLASQKLLIASNSLRKQNSLKHYQQVIKPAPLREAWKKHFAGTFAESPNITTKSQNSMFDRHMLEASVEKSAQYAAAAAAAATNLSNSNREFGDLESLVQRNQQYYTDHYNNLMQRSSSKSSSPKSTNSSPSPRTMNMVATNHSQSQATGMPHPHLDQLNQHYMNAATAASNHTANTINGTNSNDLQYSSTSAYANSMQHLSADQLHQHQPQLQHHHQSLSNQAIYQHLANNAASNLNSNLYATNTAGNAASIYHTHAHANGGAVGNGSVNGLGGNANSAVGGSMGSHQLVGASSHHHHSLNSAAAACAAAVVSQTLKSVAANHQSYQSHHNQIGHNHHGHQHQGTTGLTSAPNGLMNIASSMHNAFHPNAVAAAAATAVGGQGSAANHHHHHLTYQHSHPHAQLHHHASSIVARKYHCKICPQVFMSKAEMKYHNQNHMREAKPYKCLQCPKAFANSSYLSQHMRIHQGVKPYTCELCARKFTQLSHLQQHKRTHTGDKPYKCSFANCTKKFSQLSNLQSHSRCHQLDKPFKCNSCYKCFNDEQSLFEHIPRHLESKHLKKNLCIFCGSSYQQERGLQKHFQQYHTEKSQTLVQAAFAAGTTGNASLIASLVTTTGNGGGSSLSSNSSVASSNTTSNLTHNMNANSAVALGLNLNNF